MIQRKIVTLCGSTRFYEAFQRANYDETMAGNIVLSVGFYAGAVGEHGETTGCTPAQKVALDALHFDKIAISDEVLVLNVDGYVGDSTRNEIAFALLNDKPVRWLWPDLGVAFMRDSRGDMVMRLNANWNDRRATIASPSPQPGRPPSVDVEAIRRVVAEMRSIADKHGDHYGIASSSVAKFVDAIEGAIY